MTNADNSLQLQEASVIKQNAAQVGLNVKIRALPSAQYSRAIFQGESKKPFAAVLARFPMPAVGFQHDYDRLADA